MKRMVEHKHNSISMPPSRICGVCRNRMLDVCVGYCSVFKDYKYFVPDPNRPLETIPVITQLEFQELNGKAKGEWILYRQDKIIEEILGGSNERYSVYNPRGRRIPQNIKVEDLLSRTKERDTSLSDWKECEDTGERAPGVDSETESERTEPIGVRD